ncbi:GntR family transcriptional regulator [Herbaspirillum sp. NPDC087042]|uniref:GntR family transcriptional regulator n=1 Tax=Herbaspirillum sp. NPDC087042 TaxID=3364004 RepID=UPI00381354DA
MAQQGKHTVGSGKTAIEEQEERHEDRQEAAGELLSEQLAEQLRNQIVTDELKPGTPLRERTLAEQLQVSRTPLRDALKILAADGLVKLLPNRGAVVAELTPQQIEEKLDVLGVIEEFAAVRACQFATDQEVAELRALHHEMLAAYERRDRISYFHLNQRIHRGIVQAARNDTLAEVHGQLNRQLYRYRYQGSVSSEIWHTAIDEHQVIIDLLSRRQAQELGQYLRRHVHRTWEQLLGTP